MAGGWRHLSRVVHSGGWKYFVGRNERHGKACGICPNRIKEWDGRVWEMLIDLGKDPGETTNLAMQTRHRPHLEEGRRLLAEWHRDNSVALDPAYR